MITNIEQPKLFENPKNDRVWPKMIKNLQNLPQMFEIYLPI